MSFRSQKPAVKNEFEIFNNAAQTETEQKSNPVQKYVGHKKQNSRNQKCSYTIIASREDMTKTSENKTDKDMSLARSTLVWCVYLCIMLMMFVLFVVTII